MKLLAVVTTPSIYNGCSTQKTFWEENFTPGEFKPLNMKSCYHCNVRKPGEIKNGEKYTTSDASLKFVSLYKMKIISSEPKDYLGISGKGLITSMVLKTIRSSN